MTHGCRGAFREKGPAMGGIIIGVVVLTIVFVVAAISINNRIVRADNRCDNAWQTIDAQLQRRADLIPNLVETVKGYAAHESVTLTAITDARAAMAAAKTPDAKMAASDALSSALHHLFAVAEAYPELKANANFQQLQSDLTDTENKISYARQSYNDCVMSFNNAIETFPGSLVAGGRFETRRGFEVTDDATRQAPKVQF